MKNILYAAAFCCAGLLPLGAAAQTDQSASTRQLSSESLAVLTPGSDGASASAVETTNLLFVGTVLNEKGKPLAGALVAIGTGQDQLAVTNAEGTYMLHSKTAAPVLRVSYAGYEDVEMRVQNPQPITFNLEPIDNYKRQLKKQSKAADKAFYNK